MDSLHARVQALAQQVDSLRHRADQLEMSWDPPSQPTRRWARAEDTALVAIPQAARKLGSGSAEMHASPGERRRARLAAVMRENPALRDSAIPTGGETTQGDGMASGRNEASLAARMDSAARRADAGGDRRSGAFSIRRELMAERASAGAAADISASGEPSDTAPRISTSSSSRTSRTSTSRSNTADPSTPTDAVSITNPYRTRDMPSGAYEALQRLRQRAQDLDAPERGARRPVIVVDDPAPTSGETIAIGPVRGFASVVVGRDAAGAERVPARRPRGTLVGATRRMEGDIGVEREGMTSRGRLVAERAREAAAVVVSGNAQPIQEPEEAEAAESRDQAYAHWIATRSAGPAREARARRLQAEQSAEDAAAETERYDGWIHAGPTTRARRPVETRFADVDDARRPRLADLIRAHRLEVEDEFPTPAEAARTGLIDRVRRLADSASVLDAPEEPDPASDSFGDAAMAELRLLQNTVTRLNDRLEVARSNMAMLSAARSSLREHEEHVERMAAQQVGRVSGDPTRTGERVWETPQNQTLARRPSFPSARTPSHPHHRPRIDPANPIALVINMDNMNSFDVNFDGNIIFRPISAREPDRELVARCLSMLPGGRDGTPSRWMRLTGGIHGRPRRAGTSAGFWVRWVCQDVEGSGLRHRSMDMTTLPRITGFDFAVSPPDDDAFVRADEIEFYTARTRLHSTAGPWMHSRVRVEPFEHDPPAAAWGTSAHVRQSVEQLGGLAPGQYMRYHLDERCVEARHDRPTQASPSRGSLERVLDSYESLGMGLTSGAVPAANAIGETTDPDTAWLMGYEPAIGQIRASWRAHYRRTREEDPRVGAAVFTETAWAQTRREGSRANELWSRDYLDENGVALPARPVNEVVQAMREEIVPDSVSRTAGSADSDPVRITYV